MNIKPLSLVVAVLSALTLSACGSDSDNSSYSDGGFNNQEYNLTTTLYELQKSYAGFDKPTPLDANKLVIENGKVVRQTAYRALGSGNQDSYGDEDDEYIAVSENFFALIKDSTGYLDRDNARVRFGEFSAQYKAIDRVTGNEIDIINHYDEIDLTTAPGRDYYTPLSRDFYPPLGNNQDLSTVAFPSGSVCWSFKNRETNRDFFEIYPDESFGQTTFTTLNEFKADTIARVANFNANIDSYLDVDPGTRVTISSFRDRMVGSNNELPVTYAVIDYVSEGQPKQLYPAAVKYNGQVYEAEYLSNDNIDDEPYPECEYYNEVATNYIINNFRNTTP